MKTLFTVDRCGQLKAGMILDLIIFKDIQPPDLQNHVDSMFPKGISCHGDNYLLKNSSLANITSPAIELLFEYVRRSIFPQKPSRYSSIFGIETIEDANLFNERYGQNKGTIWEIESKDWIRCNMNLLTFTCSTLVCSYYAHKYWNGEPGPIDAFWEILLIPPVKVLCQVL